jgi:hypothetical protein
MLRRRLVPAARAPGLAPEARRAPIRRSSVHSIKLGLEVLRPRIMLAHDLFNELVELSWWALICSSLEKMFGRPSGLIGSRKTR